MNPQVTQTLSQILEITGALATIGAAVVPFVLPFVPLIVRSASARIKDSKRRRAFEVVSQAGTVATSIAAAEVQRLLAEAQKPGSPGGASITAQERETALAAGAAAAWRWAKEQGLQDLVLGVYGDEQTVKESLAAKARQNIDGNPAGMKPEPAALLPGMVQ